MVKNKEKIISIIKSHRNDIESFGVRKLGLFGSFIREEQDPESDIDFLVEFYPERKNYDNFIHLSFLLETLLEHRIELVTSESLSPYIKPNIMKEVEYVISRI